VTASGPLGSGLGDRDVAPEFRLLCLALRRMPRAEDAEALRRALAAAPDWSRLMAGARRHLVEPLLLAGLRGCGTTQVPPDVVAELHRRSMVAARRTLAQIAEIESLSRAFAQRGIRFLVLKGVALSAQLYGDAGLRGGRDIDLLVDPDGFAGAHAVLTEAGYRRRIDQLSARQTEEYRRRIKDVEYVHAVTQAHIELHYRLTDNEHLLACDFDALWRARQTVQAGGAAVPTLPRSRLALYLLAHGAAHAWERLRWLVDLAELLRAPGAVGAALEEADAAGLGPAMLHALALAHGWLGLDVAERHLVRARASARVRRLDRILMHLYAGEAWHEQPSQGSPQALARYSVWARLYRLSLKSGWRYRGTQAMREWFTPVDWSTLPLPDALFWLYPLLRPAGWLVRRWRR
jgi:putative nucleotidyltransferase-like protein